MIRKISLLWALNAFDAMITYWFVKKGMARELNPLMDAALQEGIFLQVKVWGSTLLMIFLWLKRDEFKEYQHWLIDFTLAFYSGLAIWHAYNMLRFL